MAGPISMWSRRPSRLVAVVVVLAAAVSACSSAGDDPGAPLPPQDVVRAITRALDARAGAVGRADTAGLDRQLGGGHAFRAAQDTWFRNVLQLPVRRLGYRVYPRTLVRDGDVYAIRGSLSLQLSGYDAAPVASAVRLRFRPADDDPGRLLLVAARTSEPQPWDLGPVVVRERSGVLGVFDRASLPSAPTLLDSVGSGIASVSAAVPYDWTRSVVVYALSDPTFLDGLEDVPGDDPEDLDAVAFPVGGSTRFVLNPRMVGQPGPERDRLVRHELTHVAMGGHDDHAPVWLSEGLAEYVSVRPLAPQERRIPEAAVATAEDGVSDLPDDATFNDQDSDAHYGLAWWAVEYVADAYGDDAPWRLLDAMAQPGADPDDVLRDQLGTSARDLAHQADRLILELYHRAA
jgi:hypothetical protein